MYFKNFDKIYYDFLIKGERKLSVITDITKNVRVRKELLSNITLYDVYDVKDGETPEIIAEKIYGNAKYHWIIMLANQNFDYLNDFPLAQYELEQHIKQKYNDITFLKDGNGFNTYNPVLGVTDSPSWSYIGTHVTVSAPGQLSYYQLAVGDTININGTIADTNAPNGTFIITAVDGDTITFNSGKTITGTAAGFETIKLSTINREYGTHHYVDSKGFIVDEFNPDGTSVSNYDYEETLNESKRRIKIISPKYISVVLKNFSSL